MTRAWLLAILVTSCSAGDGSPTEQDAGADAAPEAWGCTCEGEEDCGACFANIGRCCYDGDDTIGGQAGRLSGTCARTGACSTCCNECALKSCDELRAAGACPPEQVPAWEQGTQNGIYGDLAAAALSTEGLAGNEAIAALLDDPNLHKVVSYLVQCALPADASVRIGDEDLPGSIGLTPEWANGPCDTTCQEWVSACMFARTNTYRVTVSLYATSQNPADNPGDGDTGVGGREQEGAYYGNLFVEPPFEYACRGEGSDPLLDTFRVCAQPGNRCGFQNVGACGAVDGETGEPSTRHACEGFDPETMAYTQCHDRGTEPGSDDFPAGTRAYEHVMTTYVAHTAFQEGFGDACPDGDAIAPFAPADVAEGAGAICDNDDDCDTAQGLHCDARNTQGICTAACLDSPEDPGAEEQACGSGGTCFAIDDGGEGNCTSSCVPRQRGGSCERGQVCTNGWLFLSTRDDPGCRAFCASDADCPPQTPCTRFGGCGDGVDLTALADGEPCAFPEGSDYPIEECRGACVRFDDDPSRGHCASLINVAVTTRCPDGPETIYVTDSDDLALCAYRRCTEDADCTSPFVCIDTDRGKVCDFPAS